jgi:hypothetical protein
MMPFESGFKKQQQHLALSYLTGDRSKEAAAAEAKRRNRWKDCFTY